MLRSNLSSQKANQATERGTSLVESNCPDSSFLSLLANFIGLLHRPGIEALQQFHYLSATRFSSEFATLDQLQVCCLLRSRRVTATLNRVSR